MPDIFDQIETASAKPELNASGGDVFDQAVASDPFNATMPSGLRAWQDAALKEINLVKQAHPALSRKAMKAIEYEAVNRWQSLAQGRITPFSVADTTPPPGGIEGFRRSVAAGMIDVGNAMLAPFQSDERKVYLSQLNQVANAAAPTLINDIGRGIGSTVPLLAAGLATGGIASALGAGAAASGLATAGTIGAGAFLTGAGAKDIEIAQRRAAGQQISTAQKAAAMTGSGAVEAVTELLLLKGLGKVAKRLAPSIVKMLERGEAETARQIITKSARRVFAKEAGKAALEAFGEGYLEEAAAEAGDWVVNTMTIGDPRSAMQVLQDVNRAGLVGGVTGVAVGAGMAPAATAYFKRQSDIANISSATGVDPSEVKIVSAPRNRQGVTAKAISDAANLPIVWYDAGDDSGGAFFLDGRIYLNRNNADKALHEAFHGLWRNPQIRQHLESVISEGDQGGAIRRAAVDQYLAEGSAEIAKVRDAIAAVDAELDQPNTGSERRKWLVQQRTALETELQQRSLNLEQVRQSQQRQDDEAIAMIGERALSDQDIENLARENPGALRRIYLNALKFLDFMAGKTAGDIHRRAAARVAERQIRQFIEPLRRGMDRAAKRLEAEREGRIADEIRAEEAAIDRAEPMLTEIAQAERRRKIIEEEEQAIDQLERRLEKERQARLQQEKQQQQMQAAAAEQQRQAELLRQEEEETQRRLIASLQPRPLVEGAEEPRAAIAARAAQVPTLQTPQPPPAPQNVFTPAGIDFVSPAEQDVTQPPQSSGQMSGEAQLPEQEQSDATSVRSDEGQVPQTGNADQAGQGEGRPDLQRPASQQPAATEPTPEPPAEAVIEPQTQSASQEQTQQRSYGTVDSPDRNALGEHFGELFAGGGSIGTIHEARNIAGNLLGGAVKPGTPAAKVVDEAVEIGVVRAARRLMDAHRGSAVAPRTTFDAMVDLYHRQPNLSVRTSTSIEQQAYSTPVPLAFLASHLVGIDQTTTVYEPTAGNGMLLIGADPSHVIANELNPDRADALESLGFRVDRHDATKWNPDSQVDAVIANPPFGTVRGEDGKPLRWTIDGVTTDDVDQAIALRALKSLKPGGRAVLILAAKGIDAKTDIDRRAAYSRKNYPFFNELYTRYNVTDHFTVNGDLYARQGARFPVDVIVIDGNGPSTRSFPWQQSPRIYNTWQEIADAVLTQKPEGLAARKPTQGNVSRPGPSSGSGGPGPSQRPRPDTTGLPGSSGAETGLAGQPGGRSGATGKPTATGTAGLPVVQSPPAGRPATGGIPIDTGPVAANGPESGSVSGRGSTVQGGVRGDSGTGPEVVADQRSSRPRPAVVKQDKETEFQVAYTPRSGGEAMGTLVPRQMRDAVDRALESIEQRVGPLDEFVAREIGWDIDRLHGALAAEQIDAVAMAIYNHKQGDAFIIGDQTGIGKGRFVAAMIEYARKNGFVPVFVTERPDLFSDMYRDLADVGIHTPDRPFRALPTNNLVGENAITLPDGSEFRTERPKTHQKTLREAVDSFLSGGPLAAKQFGTPVTFDAIFTTYSQLQTVKGDHPERHRLLLQLGKRSFIIFDESHNAGGTRITGFKAKDEPDIQGRALLARELAGGAGGVVFSSATYAKRPEVMDLYATTSMRHAVKNPSELPAAISRGGVPLQQVVAAQLAEAGQYIRRERSYDGISFQPEVVDVGLDKADSISNVFRLINEFDKIKEGAVAGVRDTVVGGGGDIVTDTSTGKSGVQSSNFTSILWNLVDQMLFTLKVDRAADAVIESVKRGEKPVVTVDNTMETALKRYVVDNQVQSGEPINISFKDIMLRYLERSREILIKKPDGTVTHHYLTDEELGHEGVEAYREARNAIDKLASDIPASPIDWMKTRLSQAGIRVGEITGRKYMIDYGQEKPVLLTRDNEEMGSRGKIQTVRQFNNGDLDAVIINRSAASGISMHASEKFADKRQRHMIILQSPRNIDTFMQVLGRIHRTGQVTPPKYTLLMSNAPAETRPAAILAKKMASLNANVAAERSGAIDFNVPDIINEVGDDVVAQFLGENDDMLHAMDVNLPHPDDTKTNFAAQASGRVVLLPVVQQQEFWDSVTDLYNRRIEELDSVGMNPLVAKDMDLDARTLGRMTLKEGDETASDPFRKPAYLELADIKKPGKPMTPDEVIRAVKKFYGNKTAAEWSKQEIAQLETEVADYKARVIPQMKNPDAAIRREEAIDEALKTTTNWLHLFLPGLPVSVHLEDGTHLDGIVISVDRAKIKGNPAAPGAWRMKIAVADASRVVTVSFASVGKLQIGLSPYSGDTILERLQKAGSVQREKRYIATGNLLTAFSVLDNGKLISYTRSDGQKQHGVLLPKNFKPEIYFDKKPVRFKNIDHAWRFLNDRGELRTEDQQVSVKFSGSTFYSRKMIVRVPASKEKGGKYFLDKAVRDAAGQDFVKAGGRMVLTVVRDKISDVLQAMLDRWGLYAFDKKKEAREITGEKQPDIMGDFKSPAFAITAFHGTPHRFDRFSTERIGTGEGDQAFGWGLYFASRRGVAEYYRERLSPRIAGRTFPPHVFQALKNLDFLGFDSAGRAMAEIRLHPNSWRRLWGVPDGPDADVIDQYRAETRSGRVYEVSLAPKDDELLDWDATLENQSEKVKQALGALGLIPQFAEKEDAQYNNLKTNLRGSDLYQRLARRYNSQRKASMAMREAGIRGIRYKDRLSRGSEQGSHNYVIFDDADVAIQAVHAITPFRRNRTKTVGALFELNNEDIWSVIRRKFQDQFAPIARMQQEIEAQGGVLRDASDTYLRTELFHGRVGEQFRQIDDEFAKPIIDRMHSAGLTFDEVDRYLIALHAEERNRQIAKVNPNMPDGGSGMTTADAQAYLTSVSHSPKKADLEWIAKRVHALNERTLDLMVRSGLIDQESAKAMRQTYRRYVPLRTDMESDGMSNVHPGQGYDIRGKDSRRATGRSTLADSPLAFSFMQAYEKAVRAEKNRVGQALLRFVADNPDPKLWTIDRRATQKIIDPHTGLVRDAIDPLFKLRDNVVAVKMFGKTHLIEFKGEAGMAIARAFKQLGYDSGGQVIQWINKAVRVYRSLQTNLNPEFLVPNLFRDLQTAFGNLSAEQSAQVRQDFVRGIAKSWRAVWDVSGNHAAGAGQEYHDYFREYLANGGKVDSYALDDFQATTRRLSSMLAEKQATGVRRLMVGAKKAGEWIDRLNGATETATRLAAYVAARKSGMNPERAASLAKNLTVNFNRKGELGPVINTLYVFSNASIQGNARMLQALLSSKRGRKIAGWIFLAGVAQAVFLRAMTGEDDEGRNLYDTVSEEERSRNLILPAPGKNKVLKWPLPYGFNVIFSAGRIFGETLLGLKRPTEAAGSLMNTALNAFMPIGVEGSLSQTLSPTITDPFVQLSENKTWTGRPISPEQNPFGPPVPDSQLAWKSTSSVAKVIAQWLNRVTGGDEVTSGFVDISPTTIEHFVGWATGGAGRTLRKAAELPIRAASGEPITPRNVPVLSRFVGSEPEWLNIREFYDNLKRIEKLRSDLRYYLREGQEEKARKLIAEHKDELVAYRLATKTEGIVRLLRERMDKENDPQKRRRIQELMDRLVSGFNRKLRNTRQVE